MKEFTVTPSESGQKCIKYCEKLLPNAGTGFLHKMLRKKNITLNGKKADGSERLSAGDTLRFFFSDETFANFSKTPIKSSEAKPAKNSPMLDSSLIVYEDEHVLFYNKPVGLLSQKAKPEDVSLNELLLSYLNQNPSAGISKASICNRLDRNTSGLVICGKTYLGLRTMNELIAGRDVKKYYHCIVSGIVTEPILLKGFLRKDEKTNKVTIRNAEFSGASYIETEIVPLATGKRCTLLEVHLITGKTHQIRSHLAHLGHPIIGDHKYGIASVNEYYKKNYGLKCQLLHAYKLIFPQMPGEEFAVLDHREVIAPKPTLFLKIEKEEIHGHMEFQRS